MAKTLQFAMPARNMEAYAEHTASSRTAHFKGAADAAREHRTKARKAVASGQQVPVIAPKTDIRKAASN